MMRYPLDQSPLYRLTTKKKLAALLYASLPELRDLARSDDNYRLFVTGEKKRPIQEPKPALQRLHKRLCDLLSRIATPEYLHSAIKGRSYLSNARAHLGSVPLVKVDIKTFYPSVTKQAVFAFFHDIMQCTPDVADMLTMLVICDGHLPTGSSVSPILSYYAYKVMFDELEELASKRGLTMTCYVDDLTFSGINATKGFVWEARKIIAKYGLKSHKIRLFKSSQPKIVTGVVVSAQGFRLPNRRHKKIYDDFVELASEKDEAKRSMICSRLRGRVTEAAQIDEKWKNRAAQLRRELSGGGAPG